MPAAPDFPPAPDLVAPKRALISVSDKTGLVEAAKVLADLGVELVSTGGTRAAMAGAELDVRPWLGSVTAATLVAPSRLARSR